MRLDLLSDYLEQEIPGVSVFVHRMDFTIEKGILLRLPLDGVPIDWYIPGYYSCVPYQAIIRANEQLEGDALAKLVSKKLTFYKKSFAEGGVEKMFVNQSMPKNLPIVYPRLEGQGLEWSINVEANLVIPAGA